MQTDEIALLMLASGASSRFEDGDKLLAPLNGQPVISHVARAVDGMQVTAQFAVVGPQDSGRHAILKDAGWHPLINPNPAAGLASSLAIGVSKVMADTQAKAVVILLADMPFVPKAHICQLARACTGTTQAVMSVVGARLTPPALFTRTVFDQMMSLKGDRGARQLFEGLEDKAVVPLATQHAIDIDTIEELSTATTIAERSDNQRLDVAPSKD